MKKIILAVALLSLLPIAASAQVSFEPGFRAGANFSKLTQTNSDMRTGFYASFIGKLQLGSFYSLQPEIGYSQQGGENIISEEYFYEPETGNYGYLPRKDDVSISYVTVGLTNKFHFTENFNFHLGPIIDVQAGSSKFTQSELDLSFTAGVGYEILKNLDIEARVKKGIVDVIESDDIIIDDDIDGDYNTNFLFQIGLSYTFDLKK